MLKIEHSKQEKPNGREFPKSATKGTKSPKSAELLFELLVLLCG
jgi:hypothetical protein